MTTTPNSLAKEVTMTDEQMRKLPRDVLARIVAAHDEAVQELQRPDENAESGGLI